jgi:hypothetical protein
MVEELGGPIVHVQFEDDSPMVEELGGRWCLQRVAPQRGTASVTAAQVAATCFSLLSRLVVDGGVLLWVCLFCSGMFVWWCQHRLVMYSSFFFSIGSLCTVPSFS